MRPLSATPARRACWLLAATSAAALVCWSGAAVADCTGTALVNIQASGGSTCFVSGTFASTVAGVIAGQATGLGPEFTPSTLTNLGEGFSSFSFSTSADGTSAVQADSGGLVTLTVTPPLTGTVTTTGMGSIGLLATGLGESETPTPSQIVVQGVTVSTSGGNSNGVQADNGGTVTMTGGSVTTSGTGATGLIALNAGSRIDAENVDVLNTADGTPSGGAAAIFADSGGVVTMTDGSANTTGSSGLGLGIGNGAVVTLEDTTFLETGIGSGGIALNGNGAVNATGISITTKGDKDPTTGFTAFGLFNGPFNAFLGGGTATLTSSTITTGG
jgi:autotransporter family porin